MGKTSYPGQRLKKTLLNGLYATGISGLLGLLLSMLPLALSAWLAFVMLDIMNWTVEWIRDPTFTDLVKVMNDWMNASMGGMGPMTMVVIWSLRFGLSCGLFSGFLGGYRYVLQHYVLRFVLAQNHLLPRRLIPFLEYAVRLIFLRRTGGSYIFVHGLLMKHFAELDLSQRE